MQNKALFELKHKSPETQSALNDVFQSATRVYKGRKAGRKEAGAAYLKALRARMKLAAGK